MNIQPSPDHNPAGQPLSQELHDLTALRESLTALTPIPIYFIDSHIALRVTVQPSNPPEVLQVAFEVLNASQEPTVVFQSQGSIPQHLHSRILGILKGGGATGLSITADGIGSGMNPEEVVKLAQGPQTNVRIPLMAQNIYELLSKYAETQWDVVACVPSNRSSDEASVLQPVIPTIRQFIQRPSIVNEQFSSQRITSSMIERLNATVHPFGGFSVITVRANSLEGVEMQVESWKVLTPFDPVMTPEAVEKKLIEHVGLIANVFHRTGCEGVNELLNSTDIDAIPLLREQLQRDYIDRLLSSAVDNPDTAACVASRHTASSGASAQLIIGSRYAMISLYAHDQHPSSGHKVVFHCSQRLSQFSALQIHHIRRIYALLTSAKSYEREEGVEIITDLVSRREAEVTLGLLENPGQFSLRVLTAESYTPLTLLSDILDETQVDRFLAIKGIWFQLPEAFSASSIYTCLDGGRGICVHLKQQTEIGTRSDLFHHMKVEFLNDKTIRLFLKNKLGGEYRATIPRSHQEEFLSPSDTVVSLCELFARQTADSWMPLLREIQRLEDGDVYDVALREWDPRHDTIPLVTDLDACKIMETAAQVHAWMQLRGIREGLASRINYRGIGMIELQLSAGEHGPSIVFGFGDGRMRELTILRAPGAVARMGLQTNRFVRFQSDTVYLGSTAFHAIVDASASALQKVLQTSTEFRLRHDPIVPMRSVLMAAAQYMSLIEKNYK